MPSVIGTKTIRPDARAKVTGATVYTADVALDRALAAVVLRSPYPFARIKRIAVECASAMPGVAAIAYSGNVPKKPLAFGIKDQHLFPIDYARYAGEPVAAIAAETLEQARAAASAIEIDYETLAPVLTIEDALAPDGPLVHPDWQTYEKNPGRVLRRNVCAYNRIRRGDVDSALASADAVVESHFRFSPGMPGYIEPRSALARREPEGGLTLWCGSQSPYDNRDELAEFFGLEPSKVRFINQFVGGAFGGKIIMAAEWYAAALALQCSRPVRLVWSRHDDSLHIYPRHGGVAALASGARRDGTLVAMRASFTFDTGAYIGYGGGTALIATMLASAPYRIPNIDLEATLVYTNKQVAGPVRAPGGPQAVFAKEAHLDELCRKLALDPLEFRLKNAWEDGDAGPTGQRLTSVSVKETLRRAADAVGWSAPRPPNRGRGLSCTWWFSSCGESRARVEILRDGRVRIHSGNPEIGTGSAAVAFPMLAASVLGIDPGAIDVVLADTKSDAYDSGVGGSGSTYGAGMAVENAAKAARVELIKHAEDALEARADDLELRDGRAVVRGAPHHSVTFGELAAAQGGTIEGHGESAGGDDPEFDAALVESHDFASWMAPSFTATAAEVDVDPDTGQVAVRKLATAQDVGFAVNPSGVIGQIEGGAVQGLGWALTEELKFRDGILVNPDLKGYLLPTSVDAPEIEAVIVESPSVEGPRGMKGAGEPPVTTPGAAIANAIRDAVGAAPCETPMTPERVWRAMGNSS
jgi:CO/xanthine dehydrogenase Mo-binding subunit